MQKPKHKVSRKLPASLKTGFEVRRKVVAAQKLSPVAQDREKVRRWIVNLVFVVYWLLIFEGVLRKWALPSMQKIIFFIRDPFVLTIYFLAFKYRMWPRLSPIFSVGVGLSASFLGLALVQAIVLNISPIIVVYGWRNYCFYIPLAFLIGEHFRGKDLARLVRQTLWMSVPIAVLCYRQFSSPMDDIVNQSYDKGAQAMLVARGIVRTSGTFTVSAAQTLYIGTVLSMLTSVWLLAKKQRPLRMAGLLLATAAAITMIAVSGARSALVESAVIIMAGVVATFFIHRERPRWSRLLVLPALLVVAVVSYLYVFPAAYSAMVDRQLTAQATEGNSWIRVTSTFTSVFGTIPQLSLLGAGLGAYTNAASMLNTGQMGVGSEDEWSRHVQEAGIFGFAYIAYRIWLSTWLIRESVRATRRSFNPFPLVLVGFEAVTLLIGQITLQGTINGYGWLFAGFCIAANRLARRRDGGAATPVDVWK